MKSEFLNKGVENLSERFKNPGTEFRGKPFWSWNGELKEKELIRQTDIMKEMGLGGYFMHSRAGLITEYLGEDWFKCINAVSDHSEKIGMEAWLYDEDRWPSGSAGGKVTQNPKYRMKSMYLYEMKPEQFVWDETVYSAFAAKIDGINIYDYFRIESDTDLSAVCGDGYKILKFSIVYDSPESVYNGTTYIDTMMREAVEKFIELTHERYKNECGERLGTIIKGIFTDEPHRGKMMGNYSISEDGIISCAVAWTDDIFDEFRKRYRYDAEKILPELFYRKKGEILAPVKHDYIDLADNLFIERFAIPINRWCEKHGIDFTGHILHEDSLMNQTVPSGSVMRFYQHMGVPGIDILSEGNRCYWVPKQLDSAARQTGKKWKLSELYGCTGWQMDFKGHKAVGIWQAFYGINVRCHHLSWYTMEGESKRDYPASILHQAPWYKDYNLVETYFARFGVIMTEGESVCDTLVISPIESVWSMAHLGWANWIFSNSYDVDVIEKHYTELFHMIAGRQLDFDYGEEQMMAELGKAEVTDGEAVLKIGEASYKKVLISGLLTMRSSTLKLLNEFADIGGTIIFTEDVPKYADAVLSDAPRRLSCRRTSRVIPFSSDSVEAALKENSDMKVYVKDENGTTAENIYCRMRSCPEDGAVFAVLLNIDRDNSVKNSEITIYGIPDENLNAIELWDLETGEKYDIKDAVCVNGDGSISINSDFDEIQEKVFVFLKEASRDAKLQRKTKCIYSKEIKGEFYYKCSEPNICVLDFARWKLNGMPWQEEKEILKVDREIRKTVGIESRCGNMLQPWFAKLNCAGEYGALELEYDFFVETVPSTNITMCAERPENIKYSINGHELKCANFDNFWIDDCLKKLTVDKSFLRQGKNVITAEMIFKRTTNIEAIYLIGEFGVDIRGVNSKYITASASKAAFEDIRKFGMPFYSGALSYIIPKELLKKPISEEKAFISVPNFGGALVKISTKTQPENCKVIAWNPYTADITDFVKKDEDLLVTVICSRRSTFGPLHLNPPIIGAYGPGEFMTEGDNWKDEYMLLPGGIFDKIIYELRK